MAEEQNQDVAAQEQPQAQFQLQKLYVKDVSFELPNAPQIFQEDGQVEIKMNLAQRVEDLAEGIHEVVLTVTVTASLGEKTAYLAEVQQAHEHLVVDFRPLVLVRSLEPGEDPECLAEEPSRGLKVFA